jgi:hypothetical protein
MVGLLFLRLRQKGGRSGSAASTSQNDQHRWFAFFDRPRIRDEQPGDDLIGILINPLRYGLHIILSFCLQKRHERLCRTSHRMKRPGDLWMAHQDELNTLD